MYLTLLALMVFATTALLLRLEQNLANTFAKATVGELVEQLSDEHYTAARRSKTMNHREVVRIIKKTFSTPLGVQEKDLSESAKFSWAEK